MYNIVNTLYKELFQVFFFLFIFFATKNGKTYIVAISLQVSLLECGGVGLFVVVLFFYCNLMSLDYWSDTTLKNKQTY